MEVTFDELEQLVDGCAEVKCTTGQRPGGLVIVPQDMEVTDFCPVQWASEDPDSGVITTHFEYHSMENKLLKLDELGHDDPTMIKMLEGMTGVNAREIPLDGPETLAIFRSPVSLGLPANDPVIGKTGTFGVPEFGTAFAREMLEEIVPTQFDTLVRLSGLIHGTDVWLDNVQDIVASGIAAVNKCVCNRDDIMLDLIEHGVDSRLAYETMEAVRRGKVRRTGRFPESAEDAMLENNVPNWYIESCRKIAYLFPKAHCVNYVIMAFRIAWFKVHYPLAFYAAYFYRRLKHNAFGAELMTQGIDKVRDKIEELYNKETTYEEDDLLTTLEVVYEFYLRGYDFAPTEISDEDTPQFLIVDDTHLKLISRKS